MQQRSLHRPTCSLNYALESSSPHTEPRSHSLETAPQHQSLKRGGAGGIAGWNYQVGFRAWSMHLIPLSFACSDSLSSPLSPSAFSQLPHTGQLPWLSTHTHTHARTQCGDAELGLCSHTAAWLRILAPPLTGAVILDK
ncbi:LOW QUALITY PROTEIN: dendritic cell nuclear protein 1 [Rhinolophus ferrumequinum]|uniref:LOW QUALITY PROTEIN: dendritic cell nuclear protein 1 n=1 Tax=Rhinolophus ferrumequinum TaxID=59479 RepID=UPI00140F5B45|nr:LOW QUALITY PROTEIN: dendritic cell nuclear protein 1 [Rhinolophus ferrumequinum]